MSCFRVRVKISISKEPYTRPTSGERDPFLSTNATLSHITRNVLKGKSSFLLPTDITFINRSWDHLDTRRIQHLVDFLKKRNIEPIVLKEQDPERAKIERGAILVNIKEGSNLNHEIVIYENDIDGELVNYDPQRFLHDPFYKE